MSHTYEKLSGNKAKFTFTIPAEQFDEAMQKAFLKNRSKINVPGFRKGKAPRKMIESLYGEGVFYDDAFELLFPDAYEAAVKEAGVKPVDRPDVDVQEIGSGKDLQFTCEVFVRPDVTLGQYEGLTVAVAKTEVTEEQINDRIEADRQKAARTIDVEDRPVQDGDTVNLDYAGTVDGVAFEGGTAEGQTLKIGSNQFIPGFEAQMVGMNIGEERDLQVKFPDEYHAEELKGKDAVFHVKVNGIQMTELPELDDDFAADVSDEETFEAYKAGIVKELTERAEKNYDIAVENALVEKAVENAETDIPAAMIDDQIDYMIRELRMRMAYQGMKLEDYMKYTGQSMDDIKAMYRTEATSRVKMELVLEAIRDAQKIEPSEEEIEAQIKEQAENMGRDVEEFKASLNDEQKDYLKDNAAIRKVVDLLKKDAKVEEPKAEEAEEAPKAEAKKKTTRKTTKKAEATEDTAEEKAEEKAEETADEAEKKPAKKTTTRKKKTEETAE